MQVGKLPAALVHVADIAGAFRRIPIDSYDNIPQQMLGWTAVAQKLAEHPGKFGPVPRGMTGAKIPATPVITS